MNLDSVKKGLRSGYHHHWKLMSLFSAIIFFGWMAALMEGWYFAAAALGLLFLMVLVQWITIDPPNITDEDVHGPGAKDAAGSEDSRPDRPSRPRQ